MVKNYTFKQTIQASLVYQVRSSPTLQRSERGSLAGDADQADPTVPFLATPWP